MKQHQILLVLLENHTFRPGVRANKIHILNPIWKRTGMTNCGMMPFHAAEVLRQGKLRHAAHQVL
jgi:hypothetical protein